MTDSINAVLHFKGQLCIGHDESTYDFSNRGMCATVVNIQYTYLVQIPEYLYKFYKDSNYNLKTMIHNYLIDSESCNYDKTELRKIMFIDSVGFYGSLSGLIFKSDVCNIIAVSKNFSSELDFLLNPINTKETDILIQSMEKYYLDRRDAV